MLDVHQLKKTFVASTYAEQVYQQHQSLIEQDEQQYPFEQLLTTSQIEQIVHHQLQEIADEAGFMRALRILRARLMFRWIYQDANALTNIIDLTRELSDFADCCVRVAKDFAYPILVAKYGEPISDDGQLQDLIVIAMGKHGARELNLSSDIDLIFAFDENGTTDGRKCVDVQQFCILWGQKLIYLLSQITADGFVFRIDMRLRPWGDGSPLALSYNALEKYLIQHGREWERYAWIKARAITGGQQAKVLMDMTRPFVFRRYVDYSAFEAMRDMKTMIEKEVQRRNLCDDVKLGAGGIREIEFIVQVFQLLYGGSKKELQDKNCLVNLQHLADLQLLEIQVANDLRQAYLFLRRVEHAIQAFNDQQTQSLPTDIDVQQRMANTLNFADWQDFLQVLNQHRAIVQQQFDVLIRENFDDHNEQNEQDINGQLYTVLDSETQKMVDNFWNSSSLQKLPVKSLERLKTFWVSFSQAIIQSEQPQQALLRLMPLIESILRRSVYFVMLVESKGALQRLVKMATVSPWICDELSHYPVLLDEFLSMDFELPRREYLQDNLRQQLLRIEIEQVEDFMRVIRLFKKSHVLAVAGCDVLASSPLMKVSDALTEIAEVTIQQVLQFAYQQVVQRHGYPLDVHGQRCSVDYLAFAVIGYGKLGGIELGYGSDLDLVFIHQIDEQSETDGKKSISGLQFTTKVAQKFMTLMTTQTLDGRVYEIDTRLRPSGDAGMLVSSLTAFEHYQRHKAWIWEHQALVRARSIAGDEQLRAKFERLRIEILTQKRNEQEVRNEVLKMRNKMKEHLGSSKQQQEQGIFHLKQDSGGIVDIEFMTQYAVLAWGGQYPQLAHYSDNVRILEDTAQAGCVSSTEAQALIQAYLLQRAESHRLALANQKLVVQAVQWAETRTVVARLWKQLIDPTAQVDFN
ncbi:bifunctional [glutamate--ammonia ligase]-adenylyl-L-tyrosine phosphorylase/[glutamate--ammonia-ligase] adenylyltransferase [Moraxella sp. ZY210820]|uniref:bifunctional [glutamate--ammonia ligase]-adenylyl-L-tyrosine phosphorylase/[glutamate--ammonia-ligase] adenylyltransferase n=1 Tax=unclassified Moraxella TaxID=2685852 RepID=UPI0027301418|nr:bifunctional [glutamate--ammonia ligase]-adenylyl-L-tyrosine phosphorylase/[glutamate--ammonia-ligase] adenylyltransferase [Moraxella sp. ZY210820]WLF84580.1 bifunctional [glutamate--ammonia ligase]-adenylyl-L-tyrosine phosphorylase/[glutamate--ammonia-ligase] adenylyltransferase [Moraxella sp. ZY210820]